MKRILGLALCLIMLLLFLFACNGDNGGNNGGNNDTDPTATPDDSISILSDRKYRRGFTVRGLGLPIYPDHGEEETYGTDRYNPNYPFQYGLEDLEKPVWKISQWSTRYAFHDPSVTTFTTLSSGVYKYENPSKLWITDTNTGTITMGLKASECYVYGHRVSGQEWPHLLLERDLNATEKNKLSDKSAVYLTVDATLDSFEDFMGSAANPGLHSCMLMFYIYLGHYSSGSFSDMMYFGLPIFDNRYEFPVGMARGDSGYKQNETGYFIYNLDADFFLSEDNNFWKDGQINPDSNKTVRINLDALPYILDAFEEAQRQNFMKDATLDTLYISGMYIGFELPGTYDIQMTISNLDIKVKY